MRGKRILFGVALIGSALVGGGWVGRDSLRAIYYVHRLTHLADGDVAGWVEQSASWGPGVAARLLDGLAHEDASTCARVQSAVAYVFAQADDGGTAELLQELAGRFESFSTQGQQSALELATAAVTRPQPNVLASCRMLVGRGLVQPAPEVRVRAICLAMRPELQHLAPVRPFLNDSSAEVRRAAVVALGTATAIVADDDLLVLLHDADAEVKRLCRTALRGRGLREKDVELGRMVVSPRANDRLQLLAVLCDDGELDLSIWLQRLSQDPSPAVRAAAARAVGEQRIMQLQHRLEEMAQSDPELTVRPIAKHHLTQLRQMTEVQPAGATIR